MMNNRPEARSYGWNLGILSGVFAALQVLISASTARANISSIESMRWALSRLQTGGGNPLPLLRPLGSVVLVSYGSMVVTGVASLCLSWYAGRLTAYVHGRRTGGAGAGFRVALLSGLIWMAFTTIISFVLHSDGTITGVIASTPDGSASVPQLIGVLIQELILAAIGLGLGAWAGYIGSGSAPLAKMPATPPMAQPAMYGYQPIYPVYPMYPVYGAYPGSQGYSGYPMPQPQAQGYPYPSHPAPYAPATGAVPPSYPPPPDYYRSNGANAANTPRQASQPQPTGTEPTGTEPTSTEPTSTEPTGTQPSD
jgi:hypothetical protein